MGAIVPDGYKYKGISGVKWHLMDTILMAAHGYHQYIRTSGVQWHYTWVQCHIMSTMAPHGHNGTTYTCTLWSFNSVR